MGSLERFVIAFCNSIKLGGLVKISLISNNTPSKKVFKFSARSPEEIAKSPRSCGANVNAPTELQTGASILSFLTNLELSPCPRIKANTSRAGISLFLIPGIFHEI